MTSGPNANEDPDTEGKAIPPYEGRQKSGEVDGPEDSTQDGVRTGGATGPVESPDSGDEPAESERGQHASPADEQPASASDESAGESDAGTSGSSHEKGTGRAEDKP
jgi:hypothetical protein